MIDIGKRYRLKQAVYMAKALEQLDIYWLMAADNNIMLVPHAFKTGILVAASIHFIATLQHNPYLEFSVTGSAIRKELLVDPFVQKNGFVEVPALPGLGIELNPEVVHKFGVAI